MFPDFVTNRDDLDEMTNLPAELVDLFEEIGREPTVFASEPCVVVHPSPHCSD